MVAPWAQRQPNITPIAPRHPQNVRDDEDPFRPPSYGGEQNQWATTHTPYNQTSFQQLVNELMGVANNRFDHLNDMHPQNRTS